jgi:hypothetical protein
MSASRSHRQSTAVCHSAIVATLLLASTATATSVKWTPRPAVLLEGSGQFIAQDSGKGVGLYRLKETTPVRRLVGPFAALEAAANYGEKGCRKGDRLSCNRRSQGAAAGVTLRLAKSPPEGSATQSAIRPDLCFDSFSTTRHGFRASLTNTLTFGPATTTRA